MYGIQPNTGYTVGPFRGSLVVYDEDSWGSNRYAMTDRQGAYVFLSARGKYLTYTDADGFVRIYPLMVRDVPELDEDVYAKGRHYRTYTTMAEAMRWLMP